VVCTGDACVSAASLSGSYVFSYAGVVALVYMQCVCNLCRRRVQDAVLAHPMHWNQTGAFLLLCACVMPHCPCSGLCDTYYVAHVKDACAFLGDGAMLRYHQVDCAAAGAAAAAPESFFGSSSATWAAANMPGEPGLLRHGNAVLLRCSLF
jgi:hypothetical protein